MSFAVGTKRQPMGRPSARRRCPAFIAATVTATLLAGCAVAPHPITTAEQARRTDADLQSIFSSQTPVTRPITMYQAMARALKYNLDRRVKLMEEAYAHHEFKLSEFDMLPQMVASWDRTGRSNVYGASSTSLLTGTQSLEPSTSQDRHVNTSGLSLVWNILDFGVSYVNAEQKANQVLIAQERRRRAVENILQDVRVAYWRALAAQHMLKRIDPLMQEVNQGLANSKAIEHRELSEPMQALNYQHTLLDTLFQLQTLRQTLVSSKARLAALMNLPPDQDFTLAEPENAESLPLLPKNLRGLERYALLHRPELREEGYKTRISVEQSRKALLSLLPGIEFDYGLNHDSNSYLFHNSWRQYGIKVSWNLFNIFSAKPRLDAAHAGENLARERRLAMNMAVMTQVHVAYLQAGQALRSYRITDRLASVDGRILKQVRARAHANRAGRLDLIRSQLDAVISELRRDAAYAHANNAVGKVFVSIGADALPDTVDSLDVNSLAADIEHTMQHWSDMNLPNGHT